MSHRDRIAAAREEALISADVAKDLRMVRRSIEKALQPKQLDYEAVKDRLRKVVSQAVDDGMITVPEGSIEIKREGDEFFVTIEFLPFEVAPCIIPDDETCP